LAAFSRPLPAATALPGGAAICNSFRPTACRSCRSKTQTPNQDQNQTHPLSRSPLEETLEADISTWQKTGHFYFALTQQCSECRGKMRMSGLCKVEMSGFIQGGRADGTGANRVECERTGAVEGVTRSRTRPSEAGGSGATSATD